MDHTIGPPLPPTPEALLKFWRTLFPLVANTVIYRLGTCNGIFKLEQREFAREMSNGIPCRNELFFKTAAVLDTLQYANNVMTTLHFGAIFPVHHAAATSLLLLPYPPAGAEVLDLQFDLKRPRDYDRQNVFKACNSLTPLAASMGEFVMDVDLESQPGNDKHNNNDNKYDRSGVCACGSDKSVCDTCWALFMDPAQHVLMRLLRDMFGFKAILTVFSGRRGFHVWVLDRKAVTATTIQRRAWIAAIKTAWRDLPWVYEHLAPLFDTHPVLRARHDVAVEKCALSTLEKRRRAFDMHRDSVMEALYPKLDEAVSFPSTHMHKAVLVPHPVTGNMCIVMGDVNSPFRFVPSEDVIRVEDIEEADMRRSEQMILRELKKL
jgi:hypothetical protein